MKKNLWIIGIILFTAFFISSAVIFKIFDVEILPSQFFGALIGVVITAIITVLLLQGQTANEETKERNVKVFEEKTKRYNKFIDELWKIWDDRKVTLEELNELINLLLKDIIIYTNHLTVDKILDSLIKISSVVGKEELNKNSSGVIQSEIFNIINYLSEELKLGGKIEPDMQKKLNELESKVIPYIIQKEFKKKYIQETIDIINNSDEVNFSSINYEKGYLMCQVKNSNVYFSAGPLEREISKSAFIGIYIEFWNNRNFQKYRDAVRGWRKNYLKGGLFWYSPSDIINFNNTEEIEQKFYEVTTEDNNINFLAKEIIKHYQNWNIDGKKIEEIIDECTNH